MRAATTTGAFMRPNLNSTDVHRALVHDGGSQPGRRAARHREPAGSSLRWGKRRSRSIKTSAPSPFPLARSAVIPVGLLGTFAAAGGTETDGWDGLPLFVARDGTVRQFSGYEPRIVSTRTVERFIAAQPNPGDLTAYVYTFLGSSIWGIKGNGATPNERCWEYNTSSGQWHERQSQGQLTWRGHRTVWAFDKWLVGDAASTELALYRRDGAGETQRPDPVPDRIEAHEKLPLRTRRAARRFHVRAGRRHCGRARADSNRPGR